jgi:hypothetical protein
MQEQPVIRVSVRQVPLLYRHVLLLALVSMASGLAGALAVNYFLDPAKVSSTAPRHGTLTAESTQSMPRVYNVNGRYKRADELTAEERSHLVPEDFVPRRVAAILQGVSKPRE